LLELRGVAKSYGDGKNEAHVLEGVDLEVAEGELVAIVGFSGSGKTTLLSLIAGLQGADRGEILLDGKPIRGPGPERGVVFQNYSLLPWLSVYQNVALAVDQVFGDWAPRRRREWTLRHIELVNLTAATWKLPHELSGGMRQRVALARALAMNPRVLLLDEPLSALDALTRATLQDEIERIWSRDRKTVVLITNDVDEGLLLADRVLAMTPGPRARLGRSFQVELGRPRERARLNRDPRYARLRNEILRYLTELRSERRSDRPSAASRLPVLVPVHDR
jgi:nitrate/nitrite transport system ATP-binding protein